MRTIDTFSFPVNARNSAVFDQAAKYSFASLCDLLQKKLAQSAPTANQSKDVVFYYTQS